MCGKFAYGIAAALVVFFFVSPTQSFAVDAVSAGGASPGPEVGARSFQPVVSAAPEVTAYDRANDLIATTQNLINRLQEPEGWARASAADELGNTDENTSYVAASMAHDALMGLLSDPDELVRGSAINALAHLGQSMGDPTAEGAVEHALRHDSSGYVRAAAAMTLASMGDVYVANDLIGMLQGDTSSFSRGASAWALGHIFSLGNVPQSFFSSATYAPTEFSPAINVPSVFSLVVDALTHALRDEDKTVRELAAGALSQIAHRPE